MKREDEDNLIRQAKLGDQKAFSTLYDRHKPLIRYIIFDIVKNDDVADDLLSVTFTKAFSRIDSYVNPIYDTLRMRNRIIILILRIITFSCKIVNYLQKILYLSENLLIN